MQSQTVELMVVIFESMLANSFMRKLKAILKQTFTVLALIVGMFLWSNTSQAQHQNPNIVFILADDLGWADLPSYGNKFNEAPNITKLASQGMQFNNAYAANPVCSPTRASIQAGQYPARIGINDFIPGHWRPYEKVTVPKNETQYLPAQITTIAESLKKAGYATGYFGKWHLGGQPKHQPPSQGYDDVHVYAGGGYYNSKFRPDIEPTPKGRLSEILTNQSLEFIENNRSNPFFLFLAHFDVHVQLDADKDLIQKYLDKENPDNYPGNAVYASMIEHVDRSVGRVMEKLNQLGLDDNTLVVFFSDNGGLISRFDKIPLIAQNSISYYEDSPLKYVASSNAPLRGEKGTVYEGGIREPLIVRWPGKIKPGAKSDALVSSIDFYPTFLEVAGAAAPDQVLDGKSLVPTLLKNSYDEERELYWHYPVYHHDVPAGAVRKGDWKLVENQVTGEVSLYNLEYDISESTDMKEWYPEKADQLHTLLSNWQEEVEAKLPHPNPDFDPDKRGVWGTHPDRE